jgi:hypothetical protein
MKKLVKKGIALFLTVVIAFGITYTETAKTEAKESTNYTIKVNLGTNCTTIYNKNGKAIKSMICSPSDETPVGTFYVPVKYRWHEMIGNCYAQYCTRITTGILFHSVWYYTNGDKSSMSVAAYNVMGQKASHGCVRLLCKDAKWIYDHCAVGTKIVIFRGTEKDDPLGRPSFTPISTGAFTSWDPTDPDKNNPYRKSLPKVTANVKTIEYGTNVKPIDLVTIKDSLGNVLTKANAKIKISGKINTKKLGKYKIKYTVTDSNGNKITKALTFKVVDTQKPVIKGVKSKKNVAMGSTAQLLSGVSANAVSGKNLTSAIKVTVKYKKKNVKVTKGKVTFSSTGTYKITYKVTGVNKQTRTKKVTYSVTDQRVNIKLKSKKVTLSEGDKFNPYSYVESVKTYKNKNLKIKSSVKYTGTVDTSKAGTYTIKYTAQYKDLSYTARTVTLKVVVKKAEQETTVIPEETTTEEVTTPIENSTETETTAPAENATETETTASAETTTEKETVAEINGQE